MDDEELSVTQVGRSDLRLRLIMEECEHCCRVLTGPVREYHDASVGIECVDDARYVWVQG